LCHKSSVNHSQGTNVVDTPQITPEQALQYAPDESSIKAAKKLAPAHQWQQLHLHLHSDGCFVLWGDISGSAVYNSSILLGEKFNFSCNCPSFKRPCKHGLALLMCYAQQSSAFLQGKDIPEWLQKQLAKHDASTAKKQEKAAAPAKVVDEAAQAKRIAAREKKVKAALNELQQWLNDVIRLGLGQAKNLTYSDFERVKQRLVDGQAAGLVSWIEDLQSALAHPDWQHRATQQLGKLQLILSAYQGLNRLDPKLQADVRSLVGWNTPQDQVLAQAQAAQTWMIMGSRELEGVNNLRYRRQWLWSLNSQQAALVLQFSVGFQPLPPAWPATQVFDAEVGWYSSAWPQRIAIKSQTPLSRLQTLPNIGFDSIEVALQAQAQALAANPFLAIFAMLLKNVVPQQHNGQWFVIDTQHSALPLYIQGDVWPLLALSGGHPISVFGEWDGYILTILSAWHQNEVISL
jgi:hypothetical protein